MKRLLMVLTLASATLTFGAERVWQDGKLTDIQTQRTERNLSGFSVDMNVYSYSIAASAGSYVAEETRKADGLGRHTPIDLDVNAAVKFSVDKHDLYLLDKDGKEHKLRIVKHSVKE